MFTIGNKASRGTTFAFIRLLKCSNGKQANKNNNIRTILSQAINDKVQTLVNRHKELCEQLSQGNSNSTTNNIGKELSKLAPVTRLYEKLSTLEQEEASLQELLGEAKEQSDEDLELECKGEIKELTETRNTLEHRMINAILPRDDDDYQSDAIVEVRAGTGGDEASLFAAELFEAYIKIAKGQGWKTDILSQNSTEMGGIKDAVVSIASNNNKRGGGHYHHDYNNDDDQDDNDPMTGLSPFGYFRFESGVHRVQRVPVNDVRIHTSTCSVGVLQDDNVNNNNANYDELLPPSELRIETMRASGAGGQHVNTTNSAVRIIHIPTGITASIQDERSQHKNKAKALKLIAARVRQEERQRESQARGALKKSLMGSGGRSERIRTYNYPQDRITDHRSKETIHGILKLLQDQRLVAVFGPTLRQLSREEDLQEFLDEANK